MVDGPPSDANFISFHPDWQRRSINILFEHPDFLPVPEGTEVPIFPLQIMMSDDAQGTEELKAYQSKHQPYVWNWVVQAPVSQMQVTPQQYNNWSKSVWISSSSGKGNNP